MRQQHSSSCYDSNRRELPRISILWWEPPWIQSWEAWIRSKNQIVERTASNFMTTNLFQTHVWHVSLLILQMKSPYLILLGCDGILMLALIRDDAPTLESKRAMIGPVSIWWGRDVQRQLSFDDTLQHLVRCEAFLDQMNMLFKQLRRAIYMFRDTQDRVARFTEKVWELMASSIRYASTQALMPWRGCEVGDAWLSPSCA